MTKSSVALVHQTVETALQAKTRTITRQIAGFDVQEVVEVSQEASSKGFDSDREALLRTLSLAGITPLAVLPTAWWKQIVNRAKLIDLAPKNNTVCVNVTKHVQAVKDGWSPIIAFWSFLAVLFVPTTLALLAIGPLVGVPFAGVIIASVVASLVVTSFVMMTAGGFFSTLVYVGMQGGNRALLRSIVCSDGYSPLYVGVSLPTPPADVSEVLVKAERAELHIRVAAVADAVELAISPRKIIETKVRDELLKEAEERRRARMADPIIYIVRGAATAIIAQFGDFPIEQHIVDTVVRNSL